jgi:hypothetical protein
LRNAEPFSAFCRQFDRWYTGVITKSGAFVRCWLHFSDLARRLTQVRYALRSGRCTDETPMTTKARSGPQDPQAAQGCGVQWSLLGALVFLAHRCLLLHR